MPEAVKMTAPRLRFLNPKQKPETDEDIDALIDQVCSKMHVNENASRLLKYYAKQKRGIALHESNTKRATGIDNLSPIHQQLVEYGLIAHVPFKLVVIDWERITVFATYLVGKKCEKVRTNIKVPAVDECGPRPCIKELNVRNLFPRPNSNELWLFALPSKAIDTITEHIEAL